MGFYLYLKTHVFWMQLSKVLKSIGQIVIAKTLIKVMIFDTISLSRKLNIVLFFHIFKRIPDLLAETKIFYEETSRKTTCFYLQKWKIHFFDTETRLIIWKNIKKQQKMAFKKSKNLIFERTCRNFCRIFCVKIH